MYINRISVSGLKTFYKMTEHLIPKKMNKKWQETHVHNYNRKETSTFLSLYREKLFVAKQKEKRLVQLKLKSISVSHLYVV